MDSSIPRSPRATIAQSAARTISSIRWTACGVSILAIGGSRVWARTAVMSSARRTKGQRDEVDADLRAEAQVLGVHLGHRGAGGGAAGDIEPLVGGDAPPISTTASNSPSPGRVAVTRRRMRPSER
jgi:hypothetical protein